MAGLLEDDGVLSPFMAIIAVLKGIVGLCAFALPAALAKTNLVLGIILLVVVAVAEGLGTYRLAECSMKLERSGKQVDSAQGLGPLGRVSLEVFGLSGYRLCFINVMLAQFGLSCAYTRTVANTLQQIWDIPSQELYVLLGVLLCLQSSIEKMRGVALLSMVALGAFLCIVLCVLRFGLQRIEAGDAVFEDVWLPIHWWGTGACIGPAISAFEGVVVSQHVFTQMKVDDPKPFGAVIIISHVISLALFVFIGVFGLGTYGQDVEVMIFDNLPHHAIEVKLCKYTMILVVGISFQLQMFPLFSISDSLARRIFNTKEAEGENAGEELTQEFVNADASDQNDELSPLSPIKLTVSTASTGLSRKASTSASSGWSAADYVLMLLLRWGLVLISLILGAMISSLSVLKLVGGVFFAYCSMILPGGAHLRLNWSELGFFEFTSDIFLIGLGLVAVILSIIS